MIKGGIGGSAAPCGRGREECGDIEDLVTGLSRGSDGPAQRINMASDARDELFKFVSHCETAKDLLQASMLRRECYVSQSWFNRELEKVFAGSWTIVGREDEIPNPGEYLTIDTQWGGPIAVVRGKDDALNAIANVCAHRGAKVLQGQKGKSAKIGLVCPYHAWTYEFDGRLKWAPGMDAAVGFDEDNVRMNPVRIETLHGFIFVCVSSEAQPLRAVLGDLPEQLAPWFGAEGAMKDMVCVARREYEVSCNWKFVMENTSETYHTAVVHKSSLGPMKARPFPPHEGDWDAVQVPSSRSIVPLPEDFKGEHPLPTFTESSAFVNLFPSLQINVTWDCAWWMWVEPRGLAQTKVHMGFCFPKATVNLPQFPSVLERYLLRWHMAVTEDNAISLNQQRGVRSMFRKPGRYAPLEFGVHNFNNYLLGRMLKDMGQSWDPGKRVYVGGGEMWSNDDDRLRDVIEQAHSAKSNL